MDCYELHDLHKALGDTKMMKTKSFTRIISHSIQHSHTNGNHCLDFCCIGWFCPFKHFSMNKIMQFLCILCILFPLFHIMFVGFFRVITCSKSSLTHSRGWKNVHAKNQRVNKFGFVSHTIGIASSPFCICGMKTLPMMHRQLSLSVFH